MQRRLIIARCAAILAGLGGIWAIVLAAAHDRSSASVGLAAAQIAPAFGFCFLAVALWSMAAVPPPDDRSRIPRVLIARVAAGMALLVGMVAAIAHATGSEPVPDWAPRTSLDAAACFILSGLAILTLDSGSRTARRPSEWFVYTVGVLALLALLGYLYDVQRLDYMGAYAPMPIQFAVIFLALSVGVLGARQQYGLTSLLVSQSAGGVMARRLVPAAVLVPPAVGWLCVELQRGAGYGASVAWPILICLLVVIFTALIWRNGLLLNRIDARRVALEKGTRESQRLFQTIIDNSPAVIYAKDLEGKYLLVNQRFNEMMGIDSKEVLGRTDLELFDQPHANTYRVMDQKAMESGAAITEVEVLPDADGPRHYLSAKAPLRDSAGEIYGVFGISTDITDRKRSENDRARLLEGEKLAREESEALYSVARALASEPSGDKVVQRVTDAATQLTRAQFGAFFQFSTDRRGESLVLFTLSGAPREAFEHFGIPRKTPVFAPTFRGEAPIRIADVLADPRYGQNAPHKGMPKGHLPVRSYLAVPVVARNGTVLGGLFFGHADPGIFDERAERIAVSIASQAAIAVENAALVEGIQQSSQRMATQLGQLHLLDQITRAVAQRQDLVNIWPVVLKALEDHFDIDFACVLLCNEGCKTLTMADVCDKGLGVAQALGLSEGSELDIDASGFSRAVLGQFIHEPDISASGFTFPRLLASESLRDLVISPLLRESAVFGVLVAARRSARSFTSGDCEFLRQLSDHVGLAAWQAQLYMSLQRAYADLKQSQEMMLQQGRLRAVGQMASGIAHDINNALSPASLYAESLLEREPHLSSRAREQLQIIQRAIADASQTVARMRGLYAPRAATGELSAVDINTVIQQVVDLTRPRWADMPQERGVSIQLEMELDARSPRVSGVEHEIRDSVTNLVLNAVDAMPEGGVLTIRTRGASKGVDSGQITVEVSDSGCGMDEETRARCLEPFFTTKGDRGSGLGLAMVFAMAERNRATLEMESALGAGTTARLGFMPWRANVADAAQKPAVPPLSRTLRILLIDDDPTILSSLAEILRQDGHTTVLAVDGEVGVREFREAHASNTRFGVVITDLGMPKMDGRAVAIEIRGIDPSVPIIMLTGWGHRMVADEDTPAFIDRVLSKPPKVQDLRAALVDLIDKPERSRTS